jgi:hypothetical protein
MRHIVQSAKDCVAQRSDTLRAGTETREDMLAQLFEVLYTKGDKIDYSVQDIEQEAYSALYDLTISAHFSPFLTDALTKLL